MKNTLVLMILFCGLFQFTMAQQVEHGAIIKFEKEVHDYGEVAYGADGQSTFTFKNEGNAPLIISKAKGTCGCTVPTWPKTPIAPGETGTITVKYDTKRPGGISKSVLISSNATNAPSKTIRIKGAVLPRPHANDVGSVGVEALTK